MSEYKYEVDTQSKVVEAKREGRREGIQKGRQEGMQKGIQKGRKKGMRKMACETARKMKRRGIPAEQIAEDTGLSLKQIEEL
jgi:predicted transposase/invertase (TIGR01784 family)